MSCVCVESHSAIVQILADTESHISNAYYATILVWFFLHWLPIVPFPFWEPIYNIIANDVILLFIFF